MGLKDSLRGESMPAWRQTSESNFLGEMKLGGFFLQMS
jgi:hypothetical protein